MVNKEQVINDANEVTKALTDTSQIDNAINETQSELEVISELVRKLVREMLLTPKIKITLKSIKSLKQGMKRRKINQMN